MTTPVLPEPAPLRDLIDAFKRLPGVGERTARRMAYHLLQHDVVGAQELSAALTHATQSLSCTVAVVIVLRRLSFVAPALIRSVMRAYCA